MVDTNPAATDDTIVAVYDSAAHAEAAIASLEAAGVPDTAISRHAETTQVAASSAAPVREQGFWASLFGGEPDHDTAVYDRSVASGATVVSVRAPAAHLNRVIEILESHHPVDIDDRAAQFGLAPVAPAARPTGAAAAATAAAAAGDTIQLAAESLQVGKRVVNRGGTRIRRFVVETPVEHSVTLHTERVMVDRRPVTDARPVTGAAFSDRTIEMTQTSEEATVAKTARVVEEISLRKEAAERVETVRDTVRKEEVEIEQIPAATTTASSTRI